ncbi:sigma-70 family RNA polymerase sigma factor, partial [Staphylococcus saprophyticus]
MKFIICLYKMNLSGITSCIY